MEYFAKTLITRPQSFAGITKFVLISSGPSPAVPGGDAVDYGAYTGGYGAFGWYSDHPNHEGIGHRRRRRSPQEEAALGAPLRYAPAPLAPSYEADQALAGSTAYAKHPKGRVGPVYTFVKTDPKANFKWGVRNIAGSQYGK